MDIFVHLSAIPQSSPKRGRMCLIACVFEDFCDWEEIRTVFFPVFQRPFAAVSVWMSSWRETLRLWSEVFYE